MSESVAPILVAPKVLGRQTFQVYATASLPAAGATNDGLIVLEDKGRGDGNLVIYVNGLRYRLDGGTAF